MCVYVWVLLLLLFCFVYLICVGYSAEDEEETTTTALLQLERSERRAKFSSCEFVCAVVGFAFCFSSLFCLPVWFRFSFVSYCMFYVFCWRVHFTLLWLGFFQAWLAASWTGAVPVNRTRKKMITKTLSHTARFCCAQNKSLYLIFAWKINKILFEQPARAYTTLQNFVLGTKHDQSTRTSATNWS